MEHLFPFVAESEAAMTVAQFEERLLALEQAVARLEEKVGPPGPPPTNGAPDGPAEDEMIDGAEYDLVLDVPPLADKELRARVVRVEDAPVKLTFSDAEWESITALVEIEADAR